MLLGLGPVLGGFSRGCVSIGGGFALLDCQCCGCQGNWHSHSVCKQRVPVAAPSVTSAEMSFPGHCHYPAMGQEKGMAAAAQWQPVNLPAQPGEACAGSAGLLCPSAQTLLPQALQGCCAHQLRHCCPRLCPSLIFWGSWRVQLVHREAPDRAHWTSGAAVGTGKGTGCWVSFPVERSKPFQWSVCSQIFSVQLSCTFSG